MGSTGETLCLREVTMRVDDLSDPRIAEFLEGHLRDMRANSPPESVHALDLDGLRKPEITFWTAWWRAELIGCGALKHLSAEHVELKSMRTAPALRHKGLGRYILRFIMDEARGRGYSRMSLETGAAAFFKPALSLYEAHGFERCPPFDKYIHDPNSVFMTQKL